MPRFSSASKVHQLRVHNYIDANGVELTLHFPKDRTSGAGNDADVFFGDDEDSGDIDPTKDETILAVVSRPGSDASNQYGSDRQDIVSRLGRNGTFDLLVKCKMGDVLVDDSQPMGDTLFDQAKRVTIYGQEFQVTGALPGGFPGRNPYVCYAALKEQGG